MEGSRGAGALSFRAQRGISWSGAGEQGSEGSVIPSAARNLVKGSEGAGERRPCHSERSEESRGGERGGQGSEGPVIPSAARNLVKGSGGAGEQGLCHSERSEESRGGEQGSRGAGALSFRAQRGISWRGARWMRADVLVLPTHGAHPRPTPALIQPPTSKQTSERRQAGRSALSAGCCLLPHRGVVADRQCQTHTAAELYILAMVTIIETRCDGAGCYGSALLLLRVSTPGAKRRISTEGIFVREVRE